MHQSTVVELQRKLNLQQKKIKKLEKELEALLGEHVTTSSCKDRTIVECDVHQRLKSRRAYQHILANRFVSYEHRNKVEIIINKGILKVPGHEN